MEKLKMSEYENLLKVKNLKKKSKKLKKLGKLRN